MAVLASAVDSVIDLLSQAVISAADWSMSKEDPRYPAGKARLEPISVLACAGIMTVGALGVVQESAGQLWRGLTAGQLPELELGPALFAVLALAALLKAPLYWYCLALRRYSGAAEALAEDRLNDIFANIGAIATAALAAHWRRLWWADPAGGILISLVIVWRWGLITHGSVAKVVGVAAAEDTLALVSRLAEEHHPGTAVAFLRAYHAGQRVAVDIELEAPADLTIAEAAAICRELKQKLQALPEVESASVIVVPLGTHDARAVVDRPALLQSDAVCKPPGAAASLGLADLETGGMMGGLLLGGMAPEGLLSHPSAVLAAATLARVPSHAWHRAGSPPALAPAALAAESVPDQGPAAEAAAEAAPSAAPAQPFTSLAGPPLLRRLTAPAAILRSRAAGPGSPRLSLSPGSPQPLAAHTAGSPSLTERIAWVRGLRDAPSCGLRSATFKRRDPAALLRALSRRPAGLAGSAGSAMEPAGASDSADEAGALESADEAEAEAVARAAAEAVAEVNGEAAGGWARGRPTGQARLRAAPCLPSPLFVPAACGLLSVGLVCH